jgi:antigen flippase
MVSTKLVASLLGPSGVGLVGLYQSATGLVGTISSLGIGGSAVREVAEAHSSANPVRVARTVKVLRRACWVTGLLGWLFTVVLAWPLSVWTFGTSERAVPIALLGATLLFSSISSGQIALVQGTRRIGDLARLQLLPSIPSAALSVGLYSWLGERGIVPALILVSVVNLGFSWWIVRRVPLVAAPITWGESIRESGRLVSLGVAFVWSGLLGTGVALATRSWIVRDLGIDANGIYQAAWGLSGVFAGFILQAMGADFYPRLTAVAHDNTALNRMVNEQTEIGILLALPGLLATLVFAPWAILIFYTSKFVAAGGLLPWFVLGIFGRVVSWPMGYIQLVKGASRTWVVLETIFAALMLLLTWVGLRYWQLPGVSVAFALLYGMLVVGNRWIAGRLSGFMWLGTVRRLLLQSAAAISAALAISKLLPPLLAGVSGGLLLIASSYLCLLRIITLLGPNHRISKLVANIYIGRMTNRI